MRSLIASTMRSFYAVCRASAVVVLSVTVCVSTVRGQDKPSLPSAGTPSNTNRSKPTERAPAGKLPDVSKEALVFEQYHTRIHMDADGTGTRETTARVRILADVGVKAMAVLPFTYSTSFQQVDIAYVRVRKPDGSVVETPDYNVQDMPADASREAPMYSDIHQKHVAVRGLGVGDTLEYQVTLRTLKPEVPGQFWLEYSFEKNVIVLDEQLDLDVPADKTVLVASAEMQPTITAATGRKLYHWAGANLTHPDASAAPRSMKHWKPSVQVTTFTSWEQVGAWYDSLQRSSLDVTPAIRAHADSVTRGLTTPEEKLRALSNDVALHVHYVGLDFGIGRYQPHPADDVLANEYGDCKDKHTLLAVLLKAAGIDAWPVLISSQRDLDPAVPSPAQFDHVITVVPSGSSFTWIDATAEVAPTGTLMPNLRDKQALAIPTSRAAFLERTPARPPSPGSVRIDVDTQLSDHGLLKGHITQTTSGDVEMLLRLAFRRTPQSQWKELVQAIVRSQGYGGETSNPQVSDVEQIGRPLVVSFDYTRDKYYQWDDGRATHWISPPLPLMGGELPPGTNEKKPADNPALGSAGKTVYHADLRLPPGWTITLPKDVAINEDWLEYRAAYSFRNGVFTAERSLVVKKQEIPLDQWDRYLAFRRDMFEDWSREALIHPALGVPPPEPASAAAFPQGSLGRVRNDSLPVYSEMSRESDVVQTLARGTTVRIGMSVATGEGRMCNVSDAETSAKLGFVLCDALERGAGTAEPASPTSPPAQAPAASPQPASSHDGPVATLDQLKGEGRIYLVQMGDHRLPYSLEDFASWLHSKYGLEVHVLPPAAIHPSAWDPARGQYVAELLYGQIKTDHPDLAADAHAFLIGFTDGDMYAISHESKSSFTERDLKRAAIVSAEGMDDCPNAEQPNGQCLQARLRRILLKNVAILYWHLPLSYDPASLLHSPLDSDLPTEEIYESDLDPARTSWGQREGEPCLLFSYSIAAGIQPMPGAMVHSCWGSEDAPQDESQEFFEVDLRLGLLIDWHTDFNLPDTVPIQFERVLRDGWHNLNPFGVSGSDNYDEFLSSPDNITISIVHADTSREDVVRVPRNQTNLALAKYVGGPTGKYYEMHWIARPYERYELRRYDGLLKIYLPCLSPKVLCKLVGYGDSVQRQGLTFTRDNERRLVQLSSPHNSWLRFHYGQLGGIVAIDDSSGRTLRYGYDDRNRLISVTYPSGQIFRYEYDNAQHLLNFSVAPNASAPPVTILRNQYTGGKLAKQTLAGGAVYTYRYNPVGASEFRSATVQVSDGRVFNVEIGSANSTIHEQFTRPAQQ
jgi:hypothetical protein